MWIRFDEPYSYRGAGFTIVFKAGTTENVIRAAAEAAIAAGKAIKVSPVPRAPKESTNG